MEINLSFKQWFVEGQTVGGQAAVGSLENDMEIAMASAPAGKKSDAIQQAVEKQRQKADSTGGTSPATLAKLATVQDTLAQSGSVAAMKKKMKK